MRLLLLQSALAGFFLLQQGFHTAPRLIAVSARESGTGVGPSESGRAKPSPGERMRQTRIKTRESAVHDPHPDVPSMRQTGSKLPQVRTREPAVCDIPMDVRFMAADRPRSRMNA